MTLIISTPVRVSAVGKRERPQEAEKYAEQVGHIRWVGGTIPEHAMVFWPGLGCSSLWQVKELENVPGGV